MYIEVLAGPVTPLIEPAQLITDSLQVNGLTEGILGGFYGGANIFFGFGGIILLFALPYGLRFAMNFIKNILGEFGRI